MKRYNVTPERFEEMSAAQDHRCAICNEAETFRRRLSIDHCHSTNAVRGLLCVRCNAALGQMRDSPEILRAAATYLELHA